VRLYIVPRNNLARLQLFHFRSAETRGPVGFLSKAFFYAAARAMHEMKNAPLMMLEGFAAFLRDPRHWSMFARQNEESDAESGFFGKFLDL
jgi:hypothetical protein